MNEKRKILITVVALILCATASFAWMNDLQNPQGRYLTLDMENKGHISSDTITARLYAETAEGEYTDITEAYSPDTTSLFTTSDFAPGDRQRYKLVLSNPSDVAVTVSMILSGIESDSTDLPDYIVTGTTGITGLPSGAAVPEAAFPLGEKLTNGTVGFLDGLSVPPSGGQAGSEHEITIYFYLYFNPAATSVMAEKYLTIRSINLMVV